MNHPIVVVGAGPVGSLLSIALAKRGFDVRIYEKRKDWRNQGFKYVGRSINLALSARGFNALKKVELELAVKQLCVPMKQRAIHDLDGNVFYQPYDAFGSAIYSISREKLNNFLINQVEQNNIPIFWGNEPVIDPLNHKIMYSVNGEKIELEYLFLFGCDGISSSVRKIIMDEYNTTETIQPLSLGYIEIEIQKIESWDKNSLHIWPRKNFMLIALPNSDDTFTATLFLPHKGENSFDEIKDKVDTFFEKQFPDVYPYIVNLHEQFVKTQISSLKTIYTPFWSSKNSRICLLGDSAHAIVPFYGQGLNAGFEDVSEFINLLDSFNGDFSSIPIDNFVKKRKINTDAIATLALQNLEEMQLHTTQQKFRTLKNIDNHLQSLFPSIWIPQYSLVTFTPHVTYEYALKVGNLQKKYLNIIYSELGSDLYSKERYQSYISDYLSELSKL